MARRRLLRNDGWKVWRRMQRFRERVRRDRGRGSLRACVVVMGWSGIKLGESVTWR